MGNWNEKFIALTKHIASWSKDTNTKTGAVITDADHRILSVGYNGFPSGCNDNILERYQRPAKYFYTEHAERNAVFNAAKNGVRLKDSTMYIMWFPCADCSRSIIQSGIKKVVCYKPDFTIPKWGESFKAGHEMLTEAGVEILYVTE
jgi:dCMP deaminase